jgi:hypothetical protein
LNNSTTVFIFLALSSIIGIHISRKKIFDKVLNGDYADEAAGYALVDLYSSIHKAGNITLSTLIILVGLAFGISGIMTTLRLKKYFNHFYRDHRCLLIVPPIGLSIPLIIRGTMDLLIMNSKISDFLIGEYRYYYDPIQFLIVDIIPLSF